MKKKLLALLLGVSMVAVLLAGCSSSSSTTETEEKSAEEEEEIDTTVMAPGPVVEETGDEETEETTEPEETDEEEEIDVRVVEGPIQSTGPTAANVGEMAAIVVQDNKEVPNAEYTEGVEINATEQDNSTFSGSITAETYFATGIILSGSEYTVKDSDLKLLTTSSDNSEIEEGSGIPAGSGIAVRDGSFCLIEDTKIEANGAWGDMDYVRAGVVVGWQSQDSGDVVVMRDTIITNDGDDANTSNVGYFPGMGGDFNIMKNLTVSGQGRAYVALGDSVSYLYNDDISGTGWAAICTDMATDKGLYVYSVGTKAETTAGGYGVYSDTNCYDYFYNSVLQGADFGCIISNDGALNMSRLSASDSDRDSTEKAALKYATSDDIETAGSKDSVIAGGRNAIMSHATDPDYVGAATLIDTKLVTQESYKGTTEEKDYMQGYENFFEMCDGADILVKSSTLDISLINVEATSYSDTLILACVDSDNGGVEDGANAGVTSVYLENVTSDTGMNICNYDYQRAMKVEIKDMVLTGKLNCYNYEDFANHGYLNGIIDVAGTEYNGGLSLTIESGASWVVTEESTLTGLTIMAGGSIEAGDGLILNCTVDGEQVELEPGNTYEGEIVITPRAVAY